MPWLISSPSHNVNFSANKWINSYQNCTEPLKPMDQTIIAERGVWLSRNVSYDTKMSFSVINIASYHWWLKQTVKSIQCMWQLLMWLIIITKHWNFKFSCPTCEMPVPPTGINGPAPSVPSTEVWSANMTPGDYNNIRNSSYAEISFGDNIHHSWWIVLKFCTEHGSVTAVLCAKFQKDYSYFAHATAAAVMTCAKYYDHFVTIRMREKRNCNQNQIVSAKLLVKWATVLAMRSHDLQFKVTALGSWQTKYQVSNFITGHKYMYICVSVCIYMYIWRERSHI